MEPSAPISNARLPAIQPEATHARSVGPATVRIFSLVILYSLALTASLWLSYSLRFDFDVPEEFRARWPRQWAWILPMKLAFLFLCGQFAGLLSYFSIPDLRRLLYALGVSSGVLILAWMYAYVNYAPPRSVILSDFIFSLGGLVLIRLSFRLVRERLLHAGGPAAKRPKRVGIIGAGDVGASLALELSTKRRLGLQPVLFFDDDKSKWRSRVHDIPVVGPPECLLEQRLNLQLEEIIIAMPSAPAKRIGEIVRLLQKTKLKFETVPSVHQLATGQVKVSQLRSVEIQDLLGREAVHLQTESIRALLQGRIVMVTGAGGSIGSELCRQIAGFSPERILLVEQSEVQMFQIEQELVEKGFGGVVLPLVADILDLDRMAYLFKRFQPSILFHAAAHKHVPMMESQPGEAIKNNVLGTKGLAELAMQFHVQRFILISTDKAINPTNVMGATKRMAEIIIQAFNAVAGHSTKFMAVRFGNVLGSSGSVIPTFNKQIAAGGPVKVTHPEVTRYFMTIPEAAGLVLQSATQGEGGEIFVLDMGKPVKIVDLARQLIELSGLKPDEDIEIQFVGLRPGEKLFEELSHTGENITKTAHPKILRFVSEPRSIAEVKRDLSEISLRLHDTEPADLKMLLKKLVPEYQPYLTY